MTFSNGLIRSSHIPHGEVDFKKSSVGFTVCARTLIEMVTRQNIKNKRCTCLFGTADCGEHNAIIVRIVYFPLYIKDSKRL